MKFHEARHKRKISRFTSHRLKPIWVSVNFTHSVRLTSSHEDEILHVLCETNVDVSSDWHKSWSIFFSFLFPRLTAKMKPWNERWPMKWSWYEHRIWQFVSRVSISIKLASTTLSSNRNVENQNVSGLYSTTLKTCL